jgi:hypothetical protein
MSRRYAVAGAALLVLLAWTLCQGEDGLLMPDRSAAALAPSASAPAQQPVAQGTRAASWPALPAELTAAPAEKPAPGWTSLAEGRVHGDSRTPPLQRQGMAVTGPTPAQLADPAAYRSYEEGQHARTLAAFAAAAQTQAALLRADVVQARAGGIAPEEIRKVERKIERLDQQRRAIAGQGSHP